MLIVQSIEENIQSVQMSVMTGYRFSCTNTTCLPFTNTFASYILKCQIACLAETQCQAASFNPSTSNCQLFVNISNQIGNIVPDINTITMITIAGTRVPSEPTTTTTATNTTTTVPKYTALLISDSGAAVHSLINLLQSAGINSTYSSNNVVYYNGTPDAATFGVVIIVTGTSSGYDMTTNGQQSILNAQQNNATGVVLTEWAAFQFNNSLWTILRPLQLFTRSNSDSSNITMNLTIPNHPIWNNLSTSFTSTSIVTYNRGGSLINNGTILASCLQCSGGPGVAIRSSSIPATIGRIVQIAHAGHYTSGVANFNWANDINLSTMMINAVKWAANLI
ncbi:unnamed protein product [Adineta steineri]|uniref:Apple domain-containing protein n=1 Tax=Adineta steineri TaxID=433720 RepID=A0A814IQM7_9BILA|nr:unnamed protein product [Adineta steineri]CAF1119873.1 unnamed protein product [Adineta steineri]